MAELTSYQNCTLIHPAQYAMFVKNRAREKSYGLCHGKSSQRRTYEVSGGAKILDHRGKEYFESAIDPALFAPLRRLEE